MGIRCPPCRLLRGEVAEEACGDAVVQPVAAHPDEVRWGRRSLRRTDAWLWTANHARRLAVTVVVRLSCDRTTAWSRFWFGPYGSFGHPHLALDRRPPPLPRATVEHNQGGGMARRSFG